MPMLRVSTMPIIANFRKAMVAVDRLYPTRSAMLVNTTGPPLGYNLASAATISRSLYDRFLSIRFITFIVKTPLLSLLLDYLHVRPHERRRDLRDDCIARTPQESHSSGNPINQRLKAGFNAPRLSVGAGDPDCIVPESIRASGA